MSVQVPREMRKRQVDFCPESPWRLYGCYLAPKRKTLEKFADNEAKSLDENPYIEVYPLKKQERVSNSSSAPLEGDTFSSRAEQSVEKPYRIRKLHFQSLGGPLNSMLIHHFKEANQNKVFLSESLQTYETLEKLMYCQIIDLRQVPDDFVFTADCLMLEFVLQALLRTVQDRAVRGCKGNGDFRFIHLKEFLTFYLPLLEGALLPRLFKRHYAIRLVCEYRFLPPKSGHKEAAQFYAYQTITGSDDGAPKPTDPWLVFAKHDMLEDIVWYLSNVTRNDPIEVRNLVTQIVRVEEKLSDWELSRVLGLLKWSNPGVQKLFEDPSCWGKRVYDITNPLLKKANQLNITDEIAEVAEFSAFRTMLLNETKIEIPSHLGKQRISNFLYLLNLQIPGKNDRSCLSVVVEFFNIHEVPEKILKCLQVNVHVRMIEVHCICLRRETESKRYEGIVREINRISMTDALQEPVSIPLSGASCRARWANAHQNECLIRFVTTISFTEKLDAECQADIDISANH